MKSSEWEKNLKVSRGKLRTGQNDFSSLTFEGTFVLSPRNFYLGGRRGEEYFFFFFAVCCRSVPWLPIASQPKLVILSFFIHNFSSQILVPFCSSVFCPLSVIYVVGNTFFLPWLRVPKSLSSTLKCMMLGGWLTCCLPFVLHNSV